MITEYKVYVKIKPKTGIGRTLRPIKVEAESPVEALQVALTIAQGLV